KGTPETLTLILKNTSSSACQVAATPLGTVAITRAVQDGQEIAPSSLEVSFDDSPDLIIARHLMTLQPGESAEVPLRVVRKDDRIWLESIVWSPDADTIGMLYQLDPDQPVQLELHYHIPLPAHVGGTAFCADTFATIATMTSKTNWQTSFMVVIGFIVIALA